LKEVASDLTRRSRENSLVEDSDRRSLVRKSYRFFCFLFAKSNDEIHRMKISIFYSIDNSQ